MLYVTERCYESGGRVWDQVFNNVCWCLFICIFFTGDPSKPFCSRSKLMPLIPIEQVYTLDKLHLSKGRAASHRLGVEGHNVLLGQDV